MRFGLHWVTNHAQGATAAEGQSGGAGEFNPSVPVFPSAWQPHLGGSPLKWLVPGRQLSSLIHPSRSPIQSRHELCSPRSEVCAQKAG